MQDSTMRTSRVILLVALAMSAAALSGCVVQETTPRGPVEEVNQQRVLASHLDLAFRYIQRKNREKARQHLSRALEIDPGSSEAHTGYALVYKQEGELELAEKSFRQAIRANDSDTRAHFYYSVFLIEKQRLEEARRELLKVTADVDFANRALAFASLGQVESKLGNIPAARQAFERSLRLNANYAQIYLEMAEIEYLESNYQLAANYLARYRQFVRQLPARGLWLGVRLEHRLNNRDGEASYGLQLEKMFPDSKENLAYQQWRKRR